MKHYNESGRIGRRPGSGRPSKITTEIKQIVDEQMRRDDETTAFQLHRMLTERGHVISLRTILRCRTTLSWTFCGSAYCQLIRDANKEKRLAFARKYLDDDFGNVIWTDECTVQMESHRRFCCRKKGQAARPKPRFAHSVALCCSITRAGQGIRGPQPPAEADTRAGLSPLVGKYAVVVYYTVLQCVFDVSLCIYV